jgi:hypothetical protein
MKLGEIWPKEKGQIETYDISDLKQPLVISEMELTGETKKSLWLSFENSPLKHRLNKKAIYALCKHFSIDNTDELEGQKINFIIKDNEVAVKEITEETKKKK